MDIPQAAEQQQKATIAPPLWLLAELTYRCPLHCVFCYNPVDYASNLNELSTDQWISVMQQAREMGAAQLGFSGGEPLLRDDLEVLVAEARQLGFYTNLITSGVGLKHERLARLRDAGLDHIQLSFQDSTREMNDFLSHTKTFDLKSRVAAMIKEFEYPMVLNVVLHRYNLDHIERIIEMADQMGVEYLELANTQYYGWGLINRDQLLPDRAQLQRAEAAVARYREKIGNRMRILFVVPDYFEKRPKACMNGWGSVFLAVSADGSALPCHAAKTIPGLEFPQVTEHTLHDIWYHSDAFNTFRGNQWMQEPCRSCPEKEQDFGGCRCQALALTGNAANADPVCDKSPYHHVITDMIGRKPAPAIQEKPLVFRNDANSRQLAADTMAGPLSNGHKLSSS
ncbi:pyrroloquinoline quinone biosynthesis protein PqqE [Advenella mimigardefordensis]|uniref:PqqA peptide cyclase n=1 Tax=Advenella mimigardefordensis (strain DSM 17166 / LMG 22922 / DPN7) TaxID=1247726 RepID=W0PDH9_ADVMD|nr:pyrroloquinoline quinone biosynthesis protein PqqE [Advenella mimigardefordensis]AHG63517.1 coenzyme PQQ synthesis protein E [Advenella mimigardefordensis DPN7]